MNSTTEVTCPNLHPLIEREQVYWNNRYICNGCGEGFDAPQDPVRNCTSCKFDLCPACYKQQEKIKERCPENHRLYKVIDIKTFNKSYHDNMYICNSCDRLKYSPQNPTLHCLHCHYDLCPQCGEDAKKEKMLNSIVLQMEKLLIRQRSQKTATKTDKITPLKAYYFTASWCGACQNFNQLLQIHYPRWKKNNFEITTVGTPSDDYDEIMDWEGYTKNFPWKSLKFNSEEAVQLDNKFQVNRYPTLIILNANTDQVLTLQGAAQIFHFVRNKGQDPFEIWQELAQQ